MTIQELNAELRRVNLEVLYETLQKWSGEETEAMYNDKWCEGFIAGQNHAKQFVKELLENTNQTIL